MACRQLRHSSMKLSEAQGEHLSSALVMVLFASISNLPSISILTICKRVSIRVMAPWPDAPRFDRSRVSCGYEYMSGYICEMPRASILVNFLATSNTSMPDRTCLGIRMWLLFQPWQTFAMLAAEIAPLQKFNVRKAKRGVRDSYPLLLTAVATKLLKQEAHFWALSCGPGDLKRM